LEFNFEYDDWDAQKSKITATKRIRNRGSLD